MAQVQIWENPANQWGNLGSDRLRPQERQSGIERRLVIVQISQPLSTTRAWIVSIMKRRDSLASLTETVDRM